MANMINNNKNNGNSSEYRNAFVVGGGGGGGGSGSNNNISSNEECIRTGDSGIIPSIRDACNFLQPPELKPGACPYDEIIEMINDLDLQDDGIMMNHKIKAIETGFCNIVHDENMLCESMEYINNKALGDGNTALKFALLFSSRNFDALAMKETKVRSAMLKILETNFINADTYRVQDRNRLYNSITLLGEYFHRVRLADNSPITILGESLLGLLIREVSNLEAIDAKLAKLILSQITLNGDILRSKHKADLTQLLYHIRRNLIEQSELTPAVKALLLMTLDLYYSNFANLGVQLETMYTRYLVQEEDEGNNNDTIKPSSSSQLSNQMYPAQFQESFPRQQPQSQDYASVEERDSTDTQNNALSSSYENGESVSNSDYFDAQSTTKKWSEQVCEDAFCENEFLNASKSDVGSGINREVEKSSNSQRSEHYVPTETDSLNRNSRRSYKSRSSPRPLKQNLITNQDDCAQQQAASGEERDQTKPLPRWRATRFNRDTTDAQNISQRNPYRRFSASFDDDRHSVHSEGGSIRLYSINDRLKHAQDKIERSGTNNYNSIANSNWDRQSQHDDRSERSYISNYERGNSYRRGGGRPYPNRQTYDKPPRFQKNQNNKDKKIHSDSWRRSLTNSSNSHYQDESFSSSNGPESNSRSSSRARTLPRPAKSNFDSCAQTDGISNNRRSQSPTHGQYERNPKAGVRNSNVRYSSQTSLASESSANFERRNNQRNRNYGRYTQKHEQQQKHPGWKKTQRATDEPKEESNWDAVKDTSNSELVQNARQTTKYMNYLSAQK